MKRDPVVHIPGGCEDMFTEKIFKTHDVSINYAEGPSSGPALVLLHGIPGRWQEFLPIIPHLMVQWHIYALDFRGQGKSGHVAGGYHSSFYGQDLISFMKHQVTEPVILFGNSAGGLVALDAAEKAPECVKAIVLGDSPIDIEWLLGWMTSPGFKALFSAWRALAGSNHTIADMFGELAAIPVMVQDQEAPIRYADQPGVDETDLRQLAITLRNLDPDVLEYHAKGRAEEYLEGFDMDRILENITCPVLLVQANPALGGLMTDRSVEHALARLERSSHVFIKETGHDLMGSWEVGPLLRAVTAFLHSL
jgi:pimeloyl-ACP methyl ester carboxylesterase